MNRLLGTLAWLLVAVLVLPTIAGAAQAAVPLLVSALLVLGLLRLLWPSRRRR